MTLWETKNRPSQRDADIAEAGSKKKRVSKSSSRKRIRQLDGDKRDRRIIKKKKELKLATYKQEQDVAKSKSNQAYNLESARAQQQVIEQKCRLKS